MLIVLDAGHGGSDSGAVGFSGLLEKDVNLAVVLKLGKLLEKAGIYIKYTRTNDTFIPLSDRSKFANSEKADLFVSVHANSAIDVNANGVETFVCVMSGETEEFAKVVQRNVVVSSGLVDRGVKFANFAVLLNTIMPAILIEMGFLSNRDEELLFRTDSFLDDVVEGICNGIVEYLKIDIPKEPSPPIQEHWGQKSVDELLEKDIINMPKEPADKVKWAEFATVLLRLIEENSL